MYIDEAHTALDIFRFAAFFLIYEAFGPPEYWKKTFKASYDLLNPLKMPQNFNFRCQTEMVWMFKNICKNIKPYKFFHAKNIKLLVWFYKKIIRTLKRLKFQKSKNIGSLTWISLVRIKKKECSWKKFLGCP